MTVKIPISPFRELSPNTAIHHMKRYRMKERAKQIAKNETNRLHSGDHPLARSTNRITVAISIFWEKGRKRLDGDNALASCKALIDGVAESLEVNDKRFDFPPIVQDRDKKGDGYTVFELTEAQQ